jgi:hypothetical protein
VIVATLSLYNQSAAIPAATILTPRKDGLYRISLFWDTITPLDNASFWCGQFNWTDAGGAQNNSSTLHTASNDQGNNNYSPWVSTFKANGGIPVTFSVIASGSSSTCGLGSPSPIGSTYELFLTIEQLQ